jgi:hypothetical protein
MARAFDAAHGLNPLHQALTQILSLDMIKIILLFAASLLTIGCATTTPMTLGADHPANRDASISPLPPPSTTLALPGASTATTNAVNTRVQKNHDTPHAHGAPAATTQPHATGAPTTQPRAQALYVCPMHPEVVSNKPGRCPKCEMYLVKKKEAAR